MPGGEGGVLVKQDTDEEGGEGSGGAGAMVRSPRRTRSL